MSYCFKKLITFIKKERIFSFIFFLSFLSSLRTLVLPLQGDELTYLNLANNLLNGKYYLINNPSSIAPVIPFLISFFMIKSFPMLGFAFAKLFHLVLTLLGFKYLYGFLESQQLEGGIILSILALTAANPHAVSAFGSLYPEAVLFFSFWGFIFYASKPYNFKNFLLVLGFFILMSMTRYLYLVMGAVLLYILYLRYRQNKVLVYRPLFYALIFSVPILFWAKYVLNIEQSNLSEISYFNRFKTDNQLLYNIKAGLGLIQHHEVNRINGIPAFISLFVPITGIRNYVISIILIGGFVYGYFNNARSEGIKILFTSILLLMIGLIIAGTGFSRYWLVILPGVLLGYYYLSKKLKVNDKWFRYGSQIVCFIYIVNEFRLDWLILNKYI